MHINIQRAAFPLEPTPTGAPGLLCLPNLVSNTNEKLGSGYQSLNYRHFTAFIINKIGNSSDNYFLMLRTLNSACRLQWSRNYRSKPTKAEKIICTVALYDELKNLICAEKTSRVQVRNYVMFQNCCSQCYQSTLKSEWLITTIIWKKQVWIHWSRKRFYFSYSV